MLVCKKCGQEVPDSEEDLKLCPACGAPLEDDEEEDAIKNLEEENILEKEEENLEDILEEPVDPFDSMLSLDDNAPTEAEIRRESAAIGILQDQTDEPASSQLEIPEKEPMNPAKKQNMLAIIIGAAMCVAVLGVLIFAGMSTTPKQMITAETHVNPTSLRYATSEEIGVVQEGNSTPLFVNSATDINTHAAVSQMFASSSPVINTQNYVVLDNGDAVAVETSLSGMGADGQPTTSGRLMLYKADGSEPAVLDEEAQFIYAHNGTAVYYNKLVENKMTQNCYENGKITPTDEITGEKNSMVFQVSDDSNLMAIALFSEDFSSQKMGYRYSGKNYFLKENHQLFSITEDGKNLYAVLPDPETNFVDLFRIKDFATGELEKLGTKITKIALYDEDGSVAFIGDCTPSLTESDPAGSIYYYDATANSSTKMADNATTILEAYPRGFGWFNENAKGITPTEYSNSASAQATLVKGQVHYIDVAGDLKVIKTGSVPGESGLDGFLLADGYANASSASSLPSLAGEYMYWSAGADVYRYKLGSLAAPQVLPLGEDLNAKAAAQAQMGYIITGDGNILEETAGSLLVKKFDEDAATTIMSEMGQIAIIGLDNDGKRVYFISEDNSLYSKSLTGKSNPKLVLTNVYNAVTTTDGIYALQNFDPVTGGTLVFMKYDSKTPAVVSEGVTSIVAASVK